MKKRNKRIQLRAAAGAALLTCLVLACTNTLTDRPAQSDHGQSDQNQTERNDETGAGNVRVNLGLAGERTLVPGVSGLYYTLQFVSAAGYSTVNAVIASGGTATVSLRQGEWTVTASGYTDQAAFEGGVAAPLTGGTATFEAGAPGSVITVSIPLGAAQEATGSLAYSVTFPDTATIASLYLTEIDGTPVASFNPLNLLNEAVAGVDIKTKTGAAALDSGYYLLNVYLYLPNRKTAQITEIVHIYDNLETAGTWAFTAADCTVPHDRVPLYEALDTAHAAKTDIRTSANGADVSDQLQWVTDAVMTTFNNAISAAETIYQNPNAAAGDINTQTSSLTTPDSGAIAVFNAAKATGSAGTTYRTVTFDGNGGTPGENSRQVIDGTTIGTLPSASRAGYALAGWYTATSGGTQITTSTVISADITYYAQWTEAFTVATASISNAAVYQNLISVSASTYDTGHYGEASGVLKAANGAATALTISFTPDFTGTLKLNFAASVMRSSAGKIVWANQSAASTPIFASDNTEKAANTWHNFSGTDVALNVTSGTPVVLQLSDGGANGTFDWLIKGFTLTAKKVVSRDVIVDFEDSPMVYGYNSGTAEVVTFGSHGKVLKMVSPSNGGNKAGGVKINLSEGTTLNDYSMITFKIDAIGGSDASFKTGVFYITTSNSALSGTYSQNLTNNGINGVKTSLTKTETINVSGLPTNAKNLASTDTFYFAFGVNANGLQIGIDDIKLTYNGAASEVTYPLYEEQ